jgi:glutaredoxin 3
MNFTVYSKHGCPYCTKVIQVLNTLSVSKGYSIREYVLGTNFTKEEFCKEFGEGSTFPQVIYNSEHLGGCVDTVKYLQEKNMI